MNFEQEFVITHTECDAWDRMKPGSFLRRGQEIATAHCEHLGIRDSYYADNQLAFLLAKVSMEIHHMPKARQPVKIVTRAYGMKRAVYHRVTSLVDQAGTLLAQQDTRWVLIDLESRRILRKPTPELEGLFHAERLEPEQDFNLEKADSSQCAGTFTAHYSQCDRNGHVNNACYADWMCDHIPLEKLEHSPVRKMVLSFHNEIPLGSDYALHRGQTPGGYYFLACQGDSKNFEGCLIL